jgi:CBS domain-containing protein
MLSATFATFVADLIHPQSVYTLALERKGINLAPVGEVDLLDTVSVGEVMTTSFEAVRPEMPLAAAEGLMAARRRHGVPVVGDQGLVGILTLSDLARAEAIAALTVGEAMTNRPVTVSPATPVSHALERMAVLGVGRLPVVAGDDPSRLVGMFRREDAVRAYHEALGAATGRHLDRERLRRRVEPDAAYYDFRVPPGSIADGRAVREVAWPEGSTLVSVRRGTEVLVPGGATVLVAGDVVTAFGSESSRRQTIERLNAGADEPTAEIEIGQISAGEGAAPGQR